MIDLETDLKVHSAGGYASYYYLSSWKTLFDCGDGAVSRLGGRVCGLKRIFLTHGHLDHLAALPGLVWARQVGMGEHHVPLDVFYPAGDDYVAKMQEVIKSYFGREYSNGYSWSPLIWKSLQVGEGPKWTNRRVETFQTQHIEDGLTLGYKLFLTKKVLREEFRGLSKDAIIAHHQAKTFDQISEIKEECEIAFCGDSSPVEAQKLRGAKIIVHEATALEEKDLVTPNHSSLEQALQVGENACPEKMVLTHFSTRYGREQIAEAVGKMAREREIKFEVWCVYKRDLWRVK